MIALRLLPLALLAAGAYASILPTTFDINGTFEDGAALSGSVLIDTAGSQNVMSGDLSVADGLAGIEFDLVGSQELQTNGSDQNYWLVNFLSTSDPAANLALGFYLGNATDFTGYTSGILCGGDHPCSDFESSYGDPITLKAAAVVVSPEPSTALLLLGACGAFAASRRKRA
jgi:hypothetical protein